MKLRESSSLKNVALAVGEALHRHGIRAVLTGGACATIYSEGQYLSTDLDFILQSRTRQQDLEAAMADVGFHRKGDRYVHPHSPFWVEFPRGPLAIGSDYTVQPIELRGATGRTLALSATDACRDRLAAFYHWNDRQSLVVAVQIAGRQRVDLDTIREWSQREGHDENFAEFVNEVSNAKRLRSVRRRRRKLEQRTP